MADKRPPKMAGSTDVSDSPAGKATTWINHKTGDVYRGVIHMFDPGKKVTPAFAKARTEAHRYAETHWPNSPELRHQYLQKLGFMPGGSASKGGWFVDATGAIASYVATVAKDVTKAAYKDTGAKAATDFVTGPGPNAPPKPPSSSTGPDDRSGSRGAGPGSAAANMTPEQVKDLQRFLHNHGYSSLTVDGQYGPQTQEAINDWHNGVGHRNPKAFNKKYGVDPKDDKGPASTDSSSSGADSTASLTSGTSPAVNLGPMNKLIQSIAAGINGQDPMKVAQMVANQEFDPSIAEARRQLGLAQGQKATNAKTISTWFNNALAMNESGKKDIQHGYEGVSGDSEELLKNIMGGIKNQAVKGSVGRVAQSDADNLKGVALADRGLADNLKSALQLRNLDEHRVQGKEDQNHVQDVLATLSQIVGQKGAAVSAGYDKYSQQRLSNQASLFNLMSTAALLPSQIDNAGLNSILKNFQIDKYVNPRRYSTAAAKVPSYDLFKLVAQVANSSRISSDDYKLPKGYSKEMLAGTIGNVLRGVKYLEPGSPQYRQLGYQLLGSFVDQDGNPFTNVPKTWFTGRG